MHQPGVRSIAILVGTLAATGCISDIGSNPDRSCTMPSFIAQSVEAGQRNVLSSVVSATINDADSVIARYGIEAISESTPSVTPVANEVKVPILGLYPASAYNARITAFNSCGHVEGPALSFQTGSLPADLPSYSGAGPSPDSGYVVLAAGNYGIVIDNTGRVVWYHRFTNGPGLNFQAQPNGRYVARPNPEPGGVGKWIEISPSGDTTRTLGCAGGLQPRMHDMIAQSDGSYWLLCDEIRTVDLSSQNRSSAERVMGTQVQHLSSSGELLFSWSPFDHLTVDISVLDAADALANPINWTHGNAIDLDFDGNVLVSYRNLSEVLKIDTFLSRIMWDLRGTGGGITIENSPTPAFRRQHGVRFVGTDIMLLDNLGDKNGSRAERYSIAVDRSSARLVGAFAPPTSLIAQIGGSTQMLPRDHLLVSFGNGGGVEEYDSLGAVAWRLEGNPGYVFRAQRIRSLYHPGAYEAR